MEHIKNRVVALVLGMVFAWASVTITGIGAAVYVPPELLKPLIEVLGQWAFALVDLFTIVIPLAATFLLLVLVSQWLVKKTDPVFGLWLVAPFVLQQMYFLLPIQQSELNTLVLTLPRCVLLATCFYLVIRFFCQPRPDRCKGSVM